MWFYDDAEVRLTCRAVLHFASDTMKSLCILATIPLLMASTLVHAQVVPLDVNLIVNGDAEAGTTGWTVFDAVSSFETIPYAGPLFLYPDAPHGDFLFAGSHSGFSAGWQSVDVSGNAAAIDAGRIGFNLNAYLGGVGDQEDNSLLYVSFLNAAGTEIGHTELGPVYIDLRDYLTVLGGFNTSGYLPGGTRAIQFSLSMDAPDGDSSGAYADNLNFTLSAAVPEPQTYALMLLGLAAVAGAVRRRTR
jgi:hypothetical protein